MRGKLNNLKFKNIFQFICFLFEYDGDDEIFPAFSSGPVIARNKNVQSKMPVSDNSRSTDPRSRRRWSENGVQVGNVFATDIFICHNK